MNKKILKQIGVAFIIIASGCFLVTKYGSSSKDIVQEDVITDDFEDTYVDDNYEMPEDVDLNEEFEDRVESEKENQSNYSSETNNNSNNTSSYQGKNNNEDTPMSNNNSQNTNSKNDSVSQKTGVFQGFADDSFVEIKIGNEYSTYKVSSNVKSILSNKNIGDSVTFEYINENGQIVITSVK